MDEPYSKESKPLHDLNNQLTVVQGYADLLLETIPPGDPRHVDLMEIVNAAKAAIDLVPEIRKQIGRDRL